MQTALHRCLFVAVASATGSPVPTHARPWILTAAPCSQMPQPRAVAQPRSRNTPNPSWEGTQAPGPAHASPAAPQGPQPRATGLQEAVRWRSGFAPPAPVPQSIPKPVLHPGSPRSAQEPLGRAPYVQAPVAAQQCRQQRVTQHGDESHSTRATHRAAFPLLACKAAARDAHVSNNQRQTPCFGSGSLYFYSFSFSTCF